MKITWQQRMTNKRVVEMAGINEISCEVRRRRWNWLGHVLRREEENGCLIEVMVYPLPWELPYGNDGGARRWFWYCLLRVSKVPQREFFAVRFRDGLDTMRSSVMRKLGVFIDEKLSADEPTKSVVIHHSIIFITLSESKNIYRVTPQRPYINSCVRLDTAITYPFGLRQAQ